MNQKSRFWPKIGTTKYWKRWILTYFRGAKHVILALKIDRKILKHLNFEVEKYQKSWFWPKISPKNIEKSLLLIHFLGENSKFFNFVQIWFNKANSLFLHEVEFFGKKWRFGTVWYVSTNMNFNFSAKNRFLKLPSSCCENESKQSHGGVKQMTHSRASSSVVKLKTTKWQFNLQIEAFCFSSCCSLRKLIFCFTVWSLFATFQY